MSKFTPVDLTSSSGMEPAPSGPSAGLHLFISDPAVLDLPDSGEITFKFKRGPVTIVEPFAGRSGTASVDLTLTEICAVKHVEEYNDHVVSNGERPDSRIDDLFTEAREQELKEIEAEETND